MGLASRWRGSRHKNSMAVDVDDLVSVDLWRIVHAKCPAYQLRREVRMVLALYSSMMDALRGHWGCGWSTCWAFIISHTKLKKGESRIKLFFSSSIQIGYPSSFNCKTYTMLQPSFNYCGKKHLQKHIFLWFVGEFHVNGWPSFHWLSFHLMKWVVFNWFLLFCTLSEI